MDAIDAALLAAWHRVTPALRASRHGAIETFHRSQRLRAAVLSRPVRPWCLCLRAGDTRLDVGRAQELRLAHDIDLSADTLRRLTAPVHLDWPGVDWTLAADLLGRTRWTVGEWIEKGYLRVRYENARSRGKRGKPVPVVWSAYPIDPGAAGGHGPDAAWGTLWQTLHRRIPDELDVTLRRVPGEVEDAANPEGSARGARARSWTWVCPGRRVPAPARAGVEGVGGGYEWRPCGRRALALYLPLPVWTVPEALGETEGFGVAAPGEGRGGGALAVGGSFHPGAADPSHGLRAAHAPIGRDDWVARGFACGACWGVQFPRLAAREGWNTFVAHITGGLLYGREVERPTEFGARTRPGWVAGAGARAERARFRRPRPVTDEGRILELLALGWSIREIGAALGVTRSAVKNRLAVLYRRNGVHGRGGLLGKVTPAVEARTSLAREPRLSTPSA